jgi:NAD(P)-dependent dehydrogenase (short-subunit alcohol dehydrogenase family)
MPEFNSNTSAASTASSNNHDGRLDGQVALITGAARGIGLAIAKRFVDEGAFVYLSDINDNEGRAATDKLGPNTAYIHLDVSNEEDWLICFKTIKKQHDHFDILVNNAGITGFMETEGPHDPENLEITSWQKVMDVNLTGTALGCKHAIRAMKKHNGGSIINISSRSGIVGIPGASAYAASKAGIRNHSKTVALYCAEQGYGIRCNSIHPAAILTPMWDPMLGEGEAREKALQAVGRDIPLGHIGDPDDVAGAALYLASDDAKYVTGIELTVDGGILAGSSARPSQSED